MFYAINSKTEEKVNSLTIEENSSYQFLNEEIWYADSDEIESCPDEINITKIKVNFRQGHRTINYNGTEYAVAPHFYIPNKTKLNINTIPESKEHNLAKNWIYNKIKQKQLTLNYSTINKPYKYHNRINLFDLPIDKKKIGIEIPAKRIGDGMGRRADVICPFIVKHPILGNGIIFEIQFSKQKVKVRVSREYDWSIRGYSIAWLYEKDFNNISEFIIDLKKEDVNVDSFANLIKQNNKSFVRDLKSTVQNECRKLDEKRYEIVNEIKKSKFEKIEISKQEIREIVEEEFNFIKDTFQPICPKCKIHMLLKSKKDGSNKFWGCSNYPFCKCTSTYGGD